MISISYLLTTVCRLEVTRMLNSLMLSAKPQDHIYLACDGLPSPEMRRWLNEYQALSPCGWTELWEPDPLGSWGHELRNKYQCQLSGDFVWHIDDDDILEPGWQEIRPMLEANRDKIHLAKFVAKGKQTVWQDKTVRFGNIGTPSGFIPNQPGRFGRWMPIYGGDFLFYGDTIARFGGIKNIVWVDRVVYRCNPETFGYR